MIADSPKLAHKFEALHIFFCGKNWWSLSWEGRGALTDSLGGGVPPLIDFVSHTILSKLLSYHHQIRFLGKIIGTTNSPTFTFLLGLPAKMTSCWRHQIVKSYTQFTIQDPELNILLSKWLPPGGSIISTTAHYTTFFGMEVLHLITVRGGGYSHTLTIRVCAAQRGRDFEAPGLEWGIHFRGVF